MSRFLLPSIFFIGLLSQSSLARPQSQSAHDHATLVGSARSTQQLWNSTSKVDQSHGATWTFTINAMGAARLDLDFAVASLSPDQPCSQCSALRIAFRFDEQQVVFNSRRYGKWDGEERRGFHIQRDDKFTLDVKLVKDGFEIVLDSTWHAKYYSRLPSSAISEVLSHAPANVTLELNYYESDAPEDSSDLERELYENRKMVREYKEVLEEYKERLDRMSANEEEAQGEDKNLETESQSQEESENNDVQNDQEREDEWVEEEEPSEDHNDVEDSEGQDEEEPETSEESESSESSESSQEYESAEDEEETSDSEDPNDDGYDDGQEDNSIETLQEEYREARKRLLNAKIEQALEDFV